MNDNTISAVLGILCLGLLAGLIYNARTNSQKIVPVERVYLGFKCTAVHEPDTSAMTCIPITPVPTNRI